MATQAVVPSLDWETIRRELQAQYGIRVDPDDPLLMQAHLFQLVIEKAREDAVMAVRSQLDVEMTAFNQSMDVSLKTRQQECHVSIQKMLTVAQCQLKLAGQECQSEIRQETAELVEAAKELRGVNRSMRFFDWMVGAVFMAFVLILGIGVGYLLRIP